MDVFPLLVCEGPFKDVTVSDGRDFSISIFGIESLPSVYGIFLNLFVFSDIENIKSRLWV